MAPAPLTRCAFAAAVLACAAPLLAACGSTPAGSAGSPGASATVTVTKTATPSSPSVTPTSSSPATPAGPPTCQASGLHAKLGLSQGTAGSIYQVIDFTNVSGADCTMFGYPGVSFVTGPGGSQIGLPASRNRTSTPKQITLAPGDVVNAVLQVVDALNYPKKDCLPVNAHWLRIYPPGDFSPLYLRYSTQACSKANKSNTTIQPIIAGSGGNS
jgi:Protein of unknown function (DUF4232)